MPAPESVNHSETIGDQIPLSPPESPGLAGQGWLVFLVLLLAAGLRALYWWLPELDGDMAMWGVQALDILAGRWHFLFSGELFGGNLEAWLAAPLFAVFGPGPRMLCLVPELFSLALVWLTWRLARTELGPAGGLMALAWVGLGPWFLMQQSWEPKGAYIEVPLLALACFGLTARLLRQTAANLQAGRATAFGLGLLAGLGLWCHLLMLPAIAACALLILLVNPRLVWGRHLVWAGLGFFLGGLPLWLISLPQGLLSEDVLLGQGRRVDLLAGWRDLWTVGLPLALGTLPPANLPGPGWWDGLRWLLALAWGGGLAALLWQRRRAIFSAQAGPGLLLRASLLYLPIFFIFWLFSGAHGQNTWRHLSPLFAVLPLLAGGMLALVAARWRLLAWGLLALALGFNLWGSLSLAPVLKPGQTEVYATRRQMELQVVHWLERNQRRHVYAQWFWDALPLTLAAEGRVTFADQVQNHFPRHLHLADAADEPTYVLSSRAVDFAHSLELAGIRARATTVGRYTVFDSFSRVQPATRELNSWDWTSPQPGAERAWDRDLGTRWTTGQSQRPGQRLVVDLGRVREDLCRLEIMPGKYEDFPGGVRVRLSADGLTWREAASHGAPFAPLFWCLDRPLIRVQPARMEIAFAPQAARYLEIVQTSGRLSSWWSVSELFIHQAVGPALAAPRPEDLARELGRSPAGPIYAPPPVLARLAPDKAGFEDPQLPGERGPALKRLDLKLGPRSLLCLPAEAWPASQGQLEGRLAEPARLSPREGWLLVSNLTPPPAPAWVRPPSGSTVRASLRPELAEVVLTGDGEERWHTGEPQRAGQWLELDLGRAVLLRGIKLEVGPFAQDGPRGLRLEMAGEDGLWQTPAGLGLVYGVPVWGGERVLRRGGPLEAHFTPLAVRRLRLTQTGSDPVHHWSVTRLLVLPAN